MHQAGEESGRVNDANWGARLLSVARLAVYCKFKQIVALKAWKLQHTLHNCACTHGEQGRTPPANERM
jgi:hypothetical protein